MGAAAGLNLLVRFLLELAAIAALVAGGVGLVDGFGGWLVGLALGASALAVWGTWIAPKAAQRLEDPARLAVEATVFGAAAVVLAVGGLPGWAAALALAYAVTVVLMFPLGQRGRA